MDTSGDLYAPPYGALAPIVPKMKVSMQDLMLDAARMEGQVDLRSHQLAVATDRPLLRSLKHLSERADNATALKVLFHWYPGAGKTIALVTLILKALLDTHVDTFFVTCPNKVPRRQTWDLLCRMLASQHAVLVVKAVLGGKRQERPWLVKKDKNGKTVEKEMSIFKFHGIEHLRHWLLDATEVVVRSNGPDKETRECRLAQAWTGSLEELWEASVSNGEYSCESISELTELLYIANIYKLKVVASVSLVSGDDFSDMQESINSLERKAWCPALATDEFHYGTLSGGCYSNIERTIRPILHVVASASPPGDFEAEHTFRRSLEEGIAEGCVPRYKETCFNIGDWPGKLGNACAAKIVLPTLTDLQSSASRDMKHNFAQARSIVAVHCLLLLALTIKEFARTRSETLRERVSLSTSFLSFCGRRWHSRLAHLCMKRLLSTEAMPATLEMVRCLVSSAEFHEKHTRKRIEIDDNFVVDSEFCDAFVLWLRDQMPTMRSFDVESGDAAVAVAESVDDTSVITFAFNCRRLVQGWNAVKLSHVLYLYWERTDAFLLQSMGRVLRAAKEKTAPWCLFIVDNAKKYSLMHQGGDSDEEAAAEEASLPKAELVGSEPARKKPKKATASQVFDNTELHRVLTAQPKRFEIPRDTISIATEAFTLAEELPRPPWLGRYGHQMPVLASGEILVLGGQARDAAHNAFYPTESWSSIDQGHTWERLDNLSPPRKGHQVVLLDDQLFIFGGSSSKGGQGGYPGHSWTSSDRGRSWAKLPQAAWRYRHGHRCAVVAGNILMIGGKFVEDCKQEVWCSSNRGETWALLPTPPWSPRCGHMLVRLGASLVLLGGETAGEVPCEDTSWSSDDGGSSWKALPSPPWKGRSGAEAVVLDNETVVIFGGLHRGVYLQDAWASNDGCQTWEELPRTPWAPRVFHQGLVVGDKLLVFGGLHGLDGITGRGDVCQDAWCAPLRVSARTEEAHGGGAGAPECCP